MSLKDIPKQYGLATISTTISPLHEKPPSGVEGTTSGNPDTDTRRGRKTQRSSSPHHNHSHNLPLASGESCGFRGRRRNRSSSPFIPTSVSVSRNTSIGLGTSRSCSPRIQYWMALSRPGSATPSAGGTTLMRWTGERMRSQSPSRSPKGRWDVGPGLGVGEGKRRRRRTRSRSRAREWAAAWEGGGERGLEDGGLKRGMKGLSGLRIEVWCEGQDSKGKGIKG